MPGHHPHVMLHYHPCVMPRHPISHLEMMFHATPTNRSDRWSMVSSVDLRKCFRKLSGIFDHRWVDSCASFESLRSSIHQQIFPMADSNQLIWSYVQISCRGNGLMVDHRVNRSGKVWCAPKEECWSPMVDVAWINGSYYT
jgi:hypothetical protein